MAEYSSSISYHKLEITCSTPCPAGQVCEGILSLKRARSEDHRECCQGQAAVTAPHNRADLQAFREAPNVKNLIATTNIEHHHSLRHQQKRLGTLS